MEIQSETNSAYGETLRISAHKLSIQEMFKAMGSGPGGLSGEESEKRLQQYGRNAISKVREKPLYLKFLANFTHLMAILLWVGGGMAFIGRMPQLGWAIWAVIVINAVFSFWQEHRAEQAMAALQKLLPHQVKVLRDDKVMQVPAEELVPGAVKRWRRSR